MVCVAVALQKTGPVEPDASLDGLLDDPTALLRWIQDTNGGESFDDRNHAAAMAAAEIHDAATLRDARTSACRITEIYWSLTHDYGIPAATAAWCAGGRCHGLRQTPCLGDVFCFPSEMENAAYRGKDPLCRTCLTELFRILEAAKMRRQGRY